MRVHEIAPRSRANGPGVRYVVWTQGCSIRCPGCWNPGTHAAAAGRSSSVRSIVDEIVALGRSIEGITVTGGEPLDQRREVLELLREVRRATSLSSILFTGYTLDQFAGFSEAPEIERHLDVLIAGPYRASPRAARGLRGSEEKAVRLLTDRYALRDLEAVPDAEIVVLPGGEVVSSGMRPLPFASEGSIGG